MPTGRLANIADGRDPEAEPDRGPLVRREVEQIVHAIRPPYSAEPIKPSRALAARGQHRKALALEHRACGGGADEVQERRASGLLESFVSATG